MQVYTESPLVLRESLGSSHNRLTSAEDYARGFTFGLSARRSFGREECIPCRTERQSLTPTYPGLNAGACAHHGVNLSSSLLVWPVYNFTEYSPSCFPWAG